MKISKHDEDIHGASRSITSRTKRVQDSHQDHGQANERHLHHEGQLTPEVELHNPSLRNAGLIFERALIHPRHSPPWHQQRRKWTGKLWNGNIDALARSVRRILPPGRIEQGEKALAYFLKNRKAMRYDEFRNQGYFIGSGVVEAACKTLVCQRFKASGMHWSQKGLKNLLAIRTALLSHRYEDFWTWRATSKNAA